MKVNKKKYLPRVAKQPSLLSYLLLFSLIMEDI
jgi:hypothetical protein